MTGKLPLNPGQRFADDFEILEEIGSGGYGAVYLVKQISTDRKRALKLLKPDLVHDLDAEARLNLFRRFQDEAKVGAKIDNEHVVEVIAAGIDRDLDTPWLAMEFLSGEDLGSYVFPDKFLPLADVREIFEQLCEAVGAAHDNNIIHRDLKPENIFLGISKKRRSKFTVKVLDFGIAKILADVRSSSHHSQTVETVTRMLGTPLWMAPEQINLPRPIGPATDVWALGLIAFRLLTGHIFWDQRLNDRSPWGVLLEMIKPHHADASARAEKLGCPERIPPGFDPWFARCVANDPDDRFQHATIAGRELERLLTLAIDQGSPSKLGAQKPADALPLPPTLPLQLSMKKKDAAPLPPTMPLLLSRKKDAAPLPPTMPLLLSVKKKAPAPLPPTLPLLLSNKKKMPRAPAPITPKSSAAPAKPRVDILTIALIAAAVLAVVGNLLLRRNQRDGQPARSPSEQSNGPMPTNPPLGLPLSPPSSGPP